MTQILNFMGEYPIFTIILLLVIFSFVVDAIYAVRGKKPMPDDEKD